MLCVQTAFNLNENNRIVAGILIW